MNTRRTFKTTSFTLLAFSAIVFGQACSKDDDGDKPPVLGSGGSSAGAVGKGGTAGKGGAVGSGGASANGGTAQGGDAPEGGAPVSEGGRATGKGGGPGQDPNNQGGEGGVPPVGGDCFAKPKTTPDNLQFLNRCTDSRCSPFDNSARIPGFDGTLPPL